MSQINSGASESGEYEQNTRNIQHAREEQIDQGEWEETMDQEEQEEQEAVVARDEQSTRTFFALISFFLAAILLGVFLSLALDGFSKMVVLIAAVVFGMIGFLLLEKRLLSPTTPSAKIGQDEASESAAAIDTQNEEEEEHEDDESENEEDEEHDENLDGELEEIQEHRAFEKLVQEALDSIPEEFHRQMENLIIMVEDEPDEETLEHLDHKEGYILLGLYQGVPLTAQSYHRTLLPERITIYQRTIERYCHGDPERIRMQVQATVLHEMAHHFGMGHEEMPIWVK